MGGWAGVCGVRVWAGVGCGPRRQKDPWKKFGEKIGALQEISASPKIVSAAEVENTPLAIKHGSEDWRFWWWVVVVVVVVVGGGGGGGAGVR